MHRTRVYFDFPPRQPAHAGAPGDFEAMNSTISIERLLRFLGATSDQQAAIDRILEGRLAPEPRPTGPLLLRIKDAAALLGVHRATIWRLVKAGRLETVELLGSLRVRRTDIEALANQSHAEIKGKQAK